MEEIRVADLLEIVFLDIGKGVPGLHGNHSKQQMQIGVLIPCAECLLGQLRNGTFLKQIVHPCKEWYFKRLCNKDLFVTTRTDKFAGQIEVIRSSADLTKAEMSMAIDRFKRWGAENGIYLPNPGDESLLRDIEIEMGRNRAYLGE